MPPVTWRSGADVLSILSVAYPLAAVSPDAIGGAEQVLSALDRAIVAAGHRSLIVAPEGSVCRGTLLPTPAPVGPFDARHVERCHDAFRRQIAYALANEDIDVVHMHGVDFHRYWPAVGSIPIVVTLHLWPTAYPWHAFDTKRADVHFQCVSEAQRRACPAGVKACVVRNGVDLRRWSPAIERSNFALVLGRICPEKGFHLAIDAASAADMPLVIAGTVFPYQSHEDYFRTAIAPRLNDTVRYVGALAGAEKRQMLGAARCVIIASTVRETSSLVIMEAFASGTPVVAVRSPALEELVDQGVTGWLVDEPCDLAAALRRVDQLSPTACRAAAVQRCDLEHSTSVQLSRYEAVTAGDRDISRSSAGASA